MEIQSKEDLFITLDDYAMQDDERDPNFSPSGQKRMRRGGRKNSASSSVPLSASLPTSWMHCSTAPKGSEMKVRLERSRQSARECRARKKIRYQYLEELVNHREKAVLALREEFARQYVALYRELDNGKVIPDVDSLLREAPPPAAKDEQWREYSRKGATLDSKKKNPLGG